MNTKINGRMIFESEGKNKQRNECLDNAKRRGDGLFTFFGEGTDTLMAITRGIRVRAIDNCINNIHKAYKVRAMMKKIPGCKFISFIKYTKWAQEQGETFGTIFLDLCGPYSRRMKIVIALSPKIMQRFVETDIFLTILQGRETELKGREREQFNIDRDKEIIEIYRQVGVTATIIKINQYTNDSGQTMHVIHLKCTKA